MFNPSPTAGDPTAPANRLNDELLKVIERHDAELGADKTIAYTFAVGVVENAPGGHELAMDVRTAVVADLATLTDAGVDVGAVDSPTIISSLVVAVVEDATTAIRLARTGGQDQASN